MLLAELQHIRVLAPLPRVELAKLIGEARELFVEAGQRLAVSESVYVLASGRLTIQLRDDLDEQPLSLGTVHPGELVGDWLLSTDGDDMPDIVTAERSVLYQISACRWKSLISKFPDVGMEFQSVVLNQLQVAQSSLIRHKRFLRYYAKELWPQDSGFAAGEESRLQTAATIGLTVLPRPSEVTEKPSAPQVGWKQWLLRKSTVFGVLLGFGITALIATLFLPSELPAELIRTAIVLIWTLANWYLGYVPDYAVALTACMITVVLGLAKPAEAFAGYGEPTWFLLLGAFGVGVAIQRSGLLYRLSLHLLRLLPPTYSGQATALTLAGTILTACLPSVQSRVSIAGLLSRELSEAMRLARGSPGSAGLAMSAFLGFGQMRFLFLNGSSYSLLAWGLLPTVVRTGAGWVEWLKVAFPLGLLVLAITHVITVYWLFPEREATVQRSLVSRQLAILGDMSGQERLTLWVTLVVFAGFLLQPIHGVDQSWVALAGFLVLVVIGSKHKEQILTKMDWQYMLFFGALAGMVNLMDQTHLDRYVGAILSDRLASIGFGPVMFLVGVGLMTTLVRMLMQPGPAVLFMATTFYPIAQSVNLNPLIVGVVIVAASTTWLIPQLLASYTTMYSATQGHCFEHAQVRRLAFLHAAIVLGAIAASVSWWHYAGVLNWR